jgi:hypothetical protein
VYFRFTAGLILAVCVSMAGIWLEKQTLRLRREVSSQHYQTDVLIEWIVRKRLETQQLSAPLTHKIAQADQELPRSGVQAAGRQPRRVEPMPSTAPGDTARLRNPEPQLRFQRPWIPEGIAE